MWKTSMKKQNIHISYPQIGLLFWSKVDLQVAFSSFFYNKKTAGVTCRHFRKKYFRKLATKDIRVSEVLDSIIFFYNTMSRRVSQMVFWKV